MSSSPVSCSDPSPCYSQDQVCPGQLDWIFRHKKTLFTLFFPGLPFKSALPTPLASLQGRTVGELRQGVRQVRGCTKVGGKTIRASWAQRRRTARSWQSCPASPQQASPCHTHGPGPHFSPTRGHQSLPRQAVPSSFHLSQASVVCLLPASFQQSLFLLPRFKLPQCPSFIPLPGHFPPPPFSVHPINS